MGTVSLFAEHVPLRRKLPKERRDIQQEQDHRRQRDCELCAGASRNKPKKPEREENALQCKVEIKRNRSVRNAQAQEMAKMTLRYSNGRIPD